MRIGPVGTHYSYGEGELAELSTTERYRTLEPGPPSISRSTDRGGPPSPPSRFPVIGEGIEKRFITVLY